MKAFVKKAVKDDEIKSMIEDVLGLCALIGMLYVGLLIPNF